MHALVGGMRCCVHQLYIVASPPARYNGGRVGCNHGPEDGLLQHATALFAVNQRRNLVYEGALTARSRLKSHAAIVLP